jgi:hypothetical protein
MRVTIVDAGSSKVALERPATAERIVDRGPKKKAVLGFE